MICAAQHGCARARYETGGRYVLSTANAVVLVWAMGKSDHTTEETFVAYTGGVNKKGKS